MAKTARGTKSTFVHGYRKANGTKVGNHYRSNPNRKKK